MKLKSNKSNRFAITTVTDTNFLKGTLVLLHSFLLYNKWFSGDIVIIENDLTLLEKEQLNKFPNVKFHKVHSTLLERINILEHFLPKLKKVVKRFYSLEAFNLTNYDKVLFLDSDILCTDSTEQLFAINNTPLLAAPDRLFYQNIKRDLSTYLPITKNKQKVETESYDGFNSGVMLINNQLLQKNTFLLLIKMVNPVFFSSVQSGHTDQYLLNNFFKDKFSFIDCKYNFLLNSIEHIQKNNFSTLENAVFIHYIQVHKPWKINEDTSNNTIVSSAIALWQQHYELFKYAINQ